MAMPPPSFAPPPDDSGPERLSPASPTAGKFLDPESLEILRELRAELVDLQSLLSGVRKGQVAITTYAGYLERTGDDIAELIAAINDGDIIRSIKNTWEQMLANPLLIAPQEDFDAQTQLHYLDMLDGHINRISFLVGVLTIPSRLNDWLAKARPGYYIPFHLVFEDELPSAEDRQRVLNYLAWSPEAIRGGIIDVGSGLIYRYNQDPRARLFSFGLLVLGFLIATGAVVASVFLPVQGWPLAARDLTTLVSGWGAVLVGVAVHVGVGSLKRQRSQGGLPAVLSLGDLPLILNARVGQILLKLFLALVGLFGLVFSTSVSNLSVLNTFLVGYSLDSFIEVFSASVEQRAAAQVSALKTQF